MDTYSKASATRQSKAHCYWGEHLCCGHVGDRGPGSITADGGCIEELCREEWRTICRYARRAGIRDASQISLKRVGHQYTIAYRRCNLRADGKWHKLGVKTSRSELTVRTRKAYHAPKDRCLII